MSAYSKLRYKMWETSARLPDTFLGVLQHRMLARLLRYAHEKSPYYARTLSRDLLDPVNFHKIPVTTRADLQHSWEHMVVPSLPSWMYRNKGGTSGSTGQPIQFYCSTFGQESYEQERWYVHNKLWRFLIQRGYTMRQILNDVPMVELRAIRASDHPAHLYLRAEEVLNDPEQMVARVKEHKPVVFGCYGSFNLAFCNAVRSHGGAGSVSIPYIVNTGEILLPAQRTFIEETLNGTVIDRYGMEEFYWAIACEREPGNGLVNYAESYVIEVLDEHGLPVPVGESGRVVVTDLTNYTMPFIRYDTGDRAVLLERTGPYTRFSLAGRNIKLEFSGGTLYYYLINGIFSKNAYAVTQYQFIKKSENELEVQLAVTSEYNKFVTEGIMVRLRELLGPSTTIQITIVPAIERTSLGKTKVFVDQTSER